MSLISHFSSFFPLLKKANKDQRQLEHIITTEKSIVTLIKNAQTHLVPVTANFSGDTKNFNTSIIKVDYKKKLFFLDELSPYEGNFHLKKLKKIHLKGYLDNCILSMQCNLNQQKEEKGLLYSIIHFPTAIKSIQHREFYRINLPLTYHIKVFLKKDSGEHFEGHLNDISYNGIAIRFRSIKNTNIETQEIIPIVKIYLKQNIIINCKMEIKRIFTISNNLLIAGLLEEVTAPQQHNIQKFITHLDRQKRKSQDN